MSDLIDQWLYRLKYKLLYNKLLYGLLKLKCWFIGHDEQMGGPYEPNWCCRCDCEEPAEKTTLPELLRRRYCWLVSKEWDWFDKLDMWLCDTYRMPTWWEY